MISKPALAPRDEKVATIAPFPPARAGLPESEPIRTLIRELARMAAREDFASQSAERRGQEG